MATVHRTVCSLLGCSTLLLFILDVSVVLYKGEKYLKSAFLSSVYSLDWLPNYWLTTCTEEEDTRMWMVWRAAVKILFQVWKRWPNMKPAILDIECLTCNMISLTLPCPLMLCLKQPIVLNLKTNKSVLSSYFIFDFDLTTDGSSPLIIYLSIYLSH